ncbi:MAG: T9SS type A sorting domain-containing protein [Bacteroidetes bacterium]|nr:T9SS type A sorting domain-containing protein [Bacteroidota bacterium]
MKNLFILLGVALMINANLYTQDFYVSTSGDDSNPGTIDNPWETLQYAMDMASPGSTVHIMGGTYNEKVYLNVSGTPGNFITFQNYNNEEVVVDGSGWNDPAICEIYDQQYIRLKGLHFKHNVQFDAMGIMIEGMCRNIEIIECKISEIHFSSDPSAPVNENTNAQPLIIYGTDPEFPITDLLVLDCEIFNARTGYSEALAVNGNVDGFEISGNEVHDITNIGIDAIGHEGTCSDPAYDQARNGYIDWNTVYNCQSDYASAAGIYVDGAKDIYIENNIVYNNQWGIEVGCENLEKTASGIVVRNNFVYGNASGGIQLGGYDYPSGSGMVVNCEIVNNTLFNNATTNYYDGELTLTYSENCTIVNNIFYATNPEVQLISLEDVVTIPPGLVLDHNLWYHPEGDENAYVYWSGTDYESLSDFIAGTGYEANSQFIDPMFKSDDNVNPDLHIKVESPAIASANASFLVNAGSKDIDDENRINESLDKGADEYYASAGIFNAKSTIAFDVYPNPAKDKFSIITTGLIADNGNLELIDLFGRTVQHAKCNANSVIDVQDLEPGIYLIRLEINNTIYSSKVIIE